MKRFLTCLLLLCPASAMAQTMTWVPSTETYTSLDAVRIGPNSPINLITGTSVGDPSPPRGPQTPGVWHRVDLEPYGVAIDAKWAELTGIIGYTPASAGYTGGVNLTLMFRRVGDTSACNSYIGQTAGLTHGARSNLTVKVPLENAQFEWCYLKTTSGVQPAFPSYLANLTVRSWGR